MARLEDVCSINMGQSPESSSYNEAGEGIPFFQGNADFGKLHPTVRVWCDAPTKIAEQGDILISVRAPIGALNIANVQCCIGRGLAALTVNERLCYQKYLWYALECKVDELNSKGTGSTFKAINKKTLAETEIPLPSLDEQRSIAALLDKVSDLIAKRRAQLDKLDLLAKSRFVEMFEHVSDQVLLSDVAEVTGGLTKNSKRKDFPIKLPYLRVANVFFDTIDTDEILEIGLTEEEKRKTLLQNGDLLFVEGNGNPEQIGRVAVWQDEIVPCVHQNHLIKARFNLAKMLPTYAMNYFMTQKGREQIREKAVSTSGLYTLSVSKIESLHIPFAPMDRQLQFTDFKEKVDKSKLTIRQSLNKLETLKKALMQQYFG